MKKNIQILATFLLLILPVYIISAQDNISNISGERGVILNTEELAPPSLYDYGQYTVSSLDVFVDDVLTEFEEYNVGDVLQGQINVANTSEEEYDIYYTTYFTDYYSNESNQEDSSDNVTVDNNLGGEKREGPVTLEANSSKSIFFSQVVRANDFGQKNIVARVESPDGTILNVGGKMIDIVSTDQALNDADDEVSGGFWLIAGTVVCILLLVGLYLSRKKALPVIVLAALIISPLFFLEVNAFDYYTRTGSRTSDPYKPGLGPTLSYGDGPIAGGKAIVIDSTPGGRALIQDILSPTRYDYPQQYFYIDVKVPYKSNMKMAVKWGIGYSGSTGRPYYDFGPGRTNESCCRVIEDPYFTNAVMSGFTYGFTQYTEKVGVSIGTDVMRLGPYKVLSGTPRGKKHSHILALEHNNSERVVARFSYTSYKPLTCPYGEEIKNGRCVAIDVCPNNTDHPGIQQSVPDGYHVENNQCVPYSCDDSHEEGDLKCINGLEYEYTCKIDSWETEETGNTCTPAEPPVPTCSTDYSAGDSCSVLQCGEETPGSYQCTPSGWQCSPNEIRTCPGTDVCSNLSGVQTTPPTGTVRNSNGTCTPEDPNGPSGDPNGPSDPVVNSCSMTYAASTSTSYCVQLFDENGNPTYTQAGISEAEYDQYFESQAQAAYGVNGVITTDYNIYGIAGSNSAGQCRASVCMAGPLQKSGCVNSGTTATCYTEDGNEAESDLQATLTTSPTYISDGGQCIITWTSQDAVVCEVRAGNAGISTATAGQSVITIQDTSVGVTLSCISFDNKTIIKSATCRSRGEFSEI